MQKVTFLTSNHAIFEILAIIGGDRVIPSVVFERKIGVDWEMNRLAGCKRLFSLASAFCVGFLGGIMSNRGPMKLFPCILLSSALLLPFHLTSADADGFVALFDGKTMAGWKNPYEWGQIEVKDGEIHLTGEKKFFVITEKLYSDFVFEGDVFIPEGKANSGFIFRGLVEPNKVYGYQAEVDGDATRKWSGGLYDEGRRQWFISPIKADPESVKAFRERAGEAFKRNDWNTYRITCQGKKIKIEVNGVVTTDVEDGMDATGVIAIQHHGEKGQTYKFRNLRVKELK